MKRIVVFVVVLGTSMFGTAWAQQSELADLKAELRRQQEVIANLMRKVEELEKKQTTTVTREEFQQETKVQQDTVNSLSENLLSRVNLSGYYNLRYSNDTSPAVGAFQQHNLGVIMGKQMKRWNFLLELELANVPHHREAGGEEEEKEEGKEGKKEEKESGEDISGEGVIAVENAWMEYNQGRYLNFRVGKQLSPQYWWLHRYPNLTLSTTLPIHLRELFPPELVGAMIHGSVARPVGTSEFGLGYRVYAANNEVPNADRLDQIDRKAWGGKLEFRLPVTGRLKRFDFAADLYNGKLVSHERLTSDTVLGFEGQIEVDRFQLFGEYARGNSLGKIRFGYYLQPAVRVHEQWMAFYRLERLESSRLRQAEFRHLAGINFRPFPQIALKLEYFRTLPRMRSFSDPELPNKPSNGVATSAVFFF